MLKLVLALAAAAVPAAAAAHIVFAETTPQTGGYYAGFLRVSHACGDSPTVAIRVEIPATVIGAKPQPKPGWELSVEREKLAEPVPGENGAMITERVSAITWRGRLPADQFDQFGIMMKLPSAPGPIYFPTVQSCENGENAWVDIPPSAAEWHSVPHPAPMLDLQPAAAAMHMHQ